MSNLTPPANDDGAGLNVSDQRLASIIGRAKADKPKVMLDADVVLEAIKQRIAIYREKQELSADLQGDPDGYWEGAACSIIALKILAVDLGLKLGVEHKPERPPIGFYDITWGQTPFYPANGGE